MLCVAAGMETTQSGADDVSYLTQGNESLDMSATRHVGYETMLATNGMARAFGYNETSTFNITMSNGFGMLADSQRTTRMVARASTNPSGSRKLEYDGCRGRGMAGDGILKLAELLNAPSTNIEALCLRSRINCFLRQKHVLVDNTACYMYLL